MFQPVSRAGTPTITPPLRSEDSTVAVAKANTDALISAAMTAGRYNGIVQLPVGNIYFDNPVQATGIFDERHAGIVIRGAGPGKTVLIPIGAKGFDFVSRLVDGRSLGNIKNNTTIKDVPNVSDYEPGEVIYFWNVQSGPDRSPRIRLTIINVNPVAREVVHSPSSAGFNDFMHVKGFAVDRFNTPPGLPIPAGSTSVYLHDHSKLGFFVPGDDVLLGDGPGINQFFGEWLTVAAVDFDNAIVTFTTPTVQGYEANLACLVPGYQPFTGGGRQHMSDITLRDVSIAAPLIDLIQRPSLIRAGLRFTFDNVGFRPNRVAPPTTFSDLQFVTCGGTSVRDVTLNGRLLVGTSQDASFDNVAASAVQMHEYARDCVFTACRTTGSGGFTLGAGPCQHIDLTNCTISGYGSTGGVANVAFANNSAITGVQLRRPLVADDPVVLTGQNLRVTALASDSPLSLAEGSSGELLSPLAAGQVNDLSGPTAAWDQPLTVRRDGVVRVPTFQFGEFVVGPELVVEPPTGLNIGLKVRCRPNQSADLQQWLSEDAQADPLFAVRADGHLMTSNEESTTVTGRIVKRLKIFYPGGSGYLPIYESL